MNRQAQRGGGVGLGVGGFDQVKQKAEGAVREIAQKSRAVLSVGEGANQTPSFPGGRALAGVAGLGLISWAAVVRNSVRAGIGLAGVSLLWRSLTNRPTGRWSNKSKGAPKRALVSLKCEAIMKRDVEGITPFETLQNAAAIMRDEGIGFMPVCDGSTKVIGTLTDRDLTIRAIAEGKQGSAQVDEVYTRQVVSCSPQDELRLAQALMAQHHVSRIVCVDGEGKLVGVISLSDILEPFAR